MKVRGTGLIYCAQAIVALHLQLKLSQNRIKLLIVFFDPLKSFLDFRAIGRSLRVIDLDLFSFEFFRTKKRHDLQKQNLKGVGQCPTKDNHQPSIVSQTFELTSLKFRPSDQTVSNLGEKCGFRSNIANQKPITFNAAGNHLNQNRNQF